LLRLAASAQVKWYPKPILPCFEGQKVETRDLELQPILS